MEVSSYLCVSQTLRGTSKGREQRIYLMVTYDGAPGELMVGIKEEHHELIGVVVSSYLCLNHPGTHKMIRWSKRREHSKDDTCKSR